MVCISLDVIFLVNASQNREGAFSRWNVNLEKPQTVLKRHGVNQNATPTLKFRSSEIENIGQYNTDCFTSTKELWRQSYPWSAPNCHPIDYLSIFEITTQVPWNCFPLVNVLILSWTLLGRRISINYFFILCSKNKYQSYIQIKKKNNSDHNNVVVQVHTFCFVCGVRVDT